MLELKVKPNTPTAIQKAWGSRYNNAVSPHSTGEYAVITQVSKRVYRYDKAGLVMTFDWKGLLHYLTRESRWNEH